MPLKSRNASQLVPTFQGENKILVGKALRSRGPSHSVPSNSIRSANNAYVMGRKDMDTNTKEAEEDRRSLWYSWAEEFKTEGDGYEGGSWHRQLMQNTSEHNFNDWCLSSLFSVGLIISEFAVLSHIRA